MSGTKCCKCPGVMYTCIILVPTVHLSFASSTVLCTVYTHQYTDYWLTWSLFFLLNSMFEFEFRVSRLDIAIDNGNELQMWSKLEVCRRFILVDVTDILRCRTFFPSAGARSKRTGLSTRKRTRGQFDVHFEQHVPHWKCRYS